MWAVKDSRAWGGAQQGQTTMRRPRLLPVAIPHEAQLASSIVNPTYGVIAVRVTHVHVHASASAECPTPLAALCLCGRRCPGSTATVSWRQPGSAL